MTRGPDAGTMLVRTLLAMAARAGCPACVTRAASHAWESATFSGARHEIILAGDGAGFPDWLGALPGADVSLRGHLVAEIAIDSIERVADAYVATIAALTLIES